jgi:hypothetical protein
VVRNNNSVHTIVGGELCVFPRQDAFEHDFHLDCFAQALDPVPGHGCDVQAGGVADVNSSVVWPWRDKVLSSFAMAAIALPRICAPQPKKRFPIRRRPTIHGDDHNWGSGFFRAPDKPLGDCRSISRHSRPRAFPKAS